MTPHSHLTFVLPRHCRIINNSDTQIGNTYIKSTSWSGSWRRMLRSPILAFRNSKGPGGPHITLAVPPLASRSILMSQPQMTTPYNWYYRWAYWRNSSSHCTNREKRLTTSVTSFTAVLATVLRLLFLMSSTAVLICSSNHSISLANSCRTCSGSSGSWTCLRRSWYCSDSSWTKPSFSH